MNDIYLALVGIFGGIVGYFMGSVITATLADKVKNEEKEQERTD
jgi:hypothetical protein